MSVSKSNICIFIDLYFDICIYIYLHLPTSSCFHLHLPTSIHIYLLYRSIYTSLCVQYLINIYICILMYNTSIYRSIDSSILLHIETYSYVSEIKQHKTTVRYATVGYRTYGHIDVTIDSGGPGHSATFTIWRSTWSTWSPVAPWSMPWGLEVP